MPLIVPEDRYCSRSAALFRIISSSSLNFKWINVFPSVCSKHNFGKWKHIHIRIGKQAEYFHSIIRFFIMCNDKADIIRKASERNNRHLSCAHGLSCLPSLRLHRALSHKLRQNTDNPFGGMLFPETLGQCSVAPNRR